MQKSSKNLGNPRSANLQKTSKSPGKLRNTSKISGKFGKPWETWGMQGKTQGKLGKTKEKARKLWENYG